MIVSVCLSVRPSVCLSVCPFFCVSRPKQPPNVSKRVKTCPDRRFMLFQLGDTCFYSKIFKLGKISLFHFFTFKIVQTCVFAPKLRRGFTDAPPRTQEASEHKRQGRGSGLVQSRRTWQRRPDPGLEPGVLQNIRDKAAIADLMEV